MHLALEGETTRESAMALLWPQSNPENARHSLSQTLYELRKDLGDDWIETVGEILRASDLESDARSFDDAVAAERYGEALGLYGGPFLEGTYLVDSGEFQKWVDRQRSGIERMRRKAQHAQTESRLGEGDLDGALAVAHSWVDCDPLDDEAQHTQIKLLAAAGRRSEALSQFEEFERILHVELQVTPLDDTCRLIEQIRTGDAEVLGTHRSTALAAGATPSPSIRELLEVELSGEFDIVRKLGEGSTAVVYLAREVGLRRLVAIKVLRPEHARAETARLRFVREAQAAGRISHPNVATVFQAGLLRDEVPYLVMEWIKGTSLADRLTSERRLEGEELRRIVADIAQGLAAAHATGVVHRDVRPANVRLEEGSGRVALTDFGVAATLATGAESPERLTETGEQLGHPRYAAPEQIAGDPVTESADVYSLGVIAFEMLTGEYPFEASTEVELASAKLYEEPRRLLDVQPQADPGLAALVQRCLARKADHRPRAVEIAAELGGQGAPLTAVPPEASSQELGQLLGELQARRVPLVVAFFVAGSGLLVFGGRSLMERGVIDLTTYLLLLLFLVTSFQAALVRAWFHGKPGRHTTSAFERWLLGGVVLVWVTVSLLVLLS
ncbi:MAG: protein kinase [Longimicrobiales bacterium]